MKDILSAFQSRRSIYALGNSSPLSEDRTVELIGEALRQAPSAFKHAGSARGRSIRGASRKALVDYDGGAPEAGLRGEVRRDGGED